MKLFLDTANISEIEEAVSWGVVSGVTTNPSLVSKETGSFEDMVRRIAQLVRGPVSAEVVSSKAEDMVIEGRRLSALAKNIVVKVPMCIEGLKAIKALSSEGIRTNCTLVFSVNQALLASLAGADFVSPFIGRLDDIGADGMQLVRDIVEIFHRHSIKCQVIAASIRHPMHVTAAAAAGADIATVPFRVLRQMVSHPLTDIGIQRFLEDWEKVKQRSQGTSC
ncbi:MAG TPA: fructose-6-phosphate aldolase [Firmicutes bacterium]|nr:fructose-6-phosphate aldolase [Bacillota bacterium]